MQREGIAKGFHPRSQSVCQRQALWNWIAGCYEPLTPKYHNVWWIQQLGAARGKIVLLVVKKQNLFFFSTTEENKQRGMKNVPFIQSTFVVVLKSSTCDSSSASRKNVLCSKLCTFGSWVAFIKQGRVGPLRETTALLAQWHIGSIHWISALASTASASGVKAGQRGALQIHDMHLHINGTPFRCKQTYARGGSPSCIFAKNKSSRKSGDNGWWPGQEKH